MIRFIAIRLVEIAAMLALMSFVIYALIGLMPGDPIDLMMGADPHLSAADLVRLKALYGIDRPLIARYFGWAHAALCGDLGYSRLFAAPVDPVQSLQPHQVGGAQMRVGPHHQVDRIARHQPDERIDDKRHQRQHRRDLDEADRDKADHPLTSARPNRSPTSSMGTGCRSGAGPSAISAR